MSNIKKVQTQIRIPETIYSEIKNEAEELGISINAHLVELLWMGIKVRDKFPIVETNQSQLHHE